MSHPRNSCSFVLVNSPKAIMVSLKLQVPIYAAAQLTGAICASFTLTELLHPIKNVGTTSPSGTNIQALIMEIVVTFSMMFVTSAVATDTKAVRNHKYPISYFYYILQSYVEAYEQVH